MSDLEPMAEDEGILYEILKGMIMDNETIGFRAVVRRSNGYFKHASDLTRPPDLRKLVEVAISDQVTIRSSIGQPSKLSTIELERQIAAKDAEIRRLRDEKQLLVVSHREILLIAAELGGMASWREFAERFDMLETLRDMKALPTAEVLTISKNKTGA